MIGYLRGRIRAKTAEDLLLDVSGVGYEITCATPTLNQLIEGSEAELWIYTQVREDVLQLYGFLVPMEKAMFQSLMKVSGIGPKMAISILSQISASQLAGLIMRSDLEALAKVPKVGAKRAEQMVLALKDKLDFGGDLKAPPVMGYNQDLVSALVHLGYRSADALRVAKNLPPDIELGEGVRKCLAALHV